jgi:hypothetical protein
MAQNLTADRLFVNQMRAYEWALHPAKSAVDAGVTPAAVAGSMGFNVLAGSFWVSGAYQKINDTYVAIAASSATGTRIDLVYASGAAYYVTAGSYASGTASANPPTVAAYNLPLAHVTVPSGAGSIIASNLQDVSLRFKILGEQITTGSIPEAQIPHYWLNAGSFPLISGTSFLATSGTFAYASGTLAEYGTVRAATTSGTTAHFGTMNATTASGTTSVFATASGTNAKFLNISGTIDVGNLSGTLPDARMKTVSAISHYVYHGTNAGQSISVGSATGAFGEYPYPLMRFVMDGNKMQPNAVYYMRAIGGVGGGGSCAFQLYNLTDTAAVVTSPWITAPAGNFVETDTGSFGFAAGSKIYTFRATSSDSTPPSWYRIYVYTA